MLSPELSFGLRLNWASGLSPWAILFNKSPPSVIILGPFLSLEIWFLAYISHLDLLHVNTLQLCIKKGIKQYPNRNDISQNNLFLFMIISILMHYYDNIGPNGLKSPAQRSGQFSELGSAQLSSNILGSCWTLDQISESNFLFGLDLGNSGKFQASWKNMLMCHAYSWSFENVLVWTNILTMIFTIPMRNGIMKLSNKGFFNSMASLKILHLRWKMTYFFQQKNVQLRCAVICFNFPLFLFA